MEASVGPEFDVRLLRLLDALYSTRSVTRAADKLGQSQPAVSIALARLRKQLGDPLFVRTPEGMQPTSRTQALMPTVHEILDGLQRLASTVTPFEPATSQREFRIYMTDASHVTLLPQLFARVRKLAPQVRLEAATIDAQMGATLHSGEADLALGLIPSLEAGFYQQALFDQEWVCLCNAGHPRVGARFSLAQYMAETHVSITSGTGSQLLEGAIRRTGQARRVALRLPGFLGLPAVLSTSDLVATLPRHIGETLAKVAALRVVRCPLAIPGFTVKQYWHGRAHQDAGNRWLRGVCADLFLQDRRAKRR